MTHDRRSAALEARSLTKRYGSTVALDLVDLALPRGSVTALVGPNGAGKSTLIRAWIGFERPSAGNVAVMGVDPWTDRRHAVGLTGYVPQRPALYRDLSVEDHLALARSLRPTFDPALARGRLRSLGIRLDAKPGQLSGGEQAQIGLAIALGTRSPILLLDEPMASLDPLARRDFLSVMLDAVRSADATVVLSSHVITDIEAACDRVVVLGHGRKLLDESIADATANHVVVGDVGGQRRPEFVASLEGRDGSPLHLLRLADRSNGAVRQASLEEVVIGYLTRGRERAA